MRRIGTGILTLAALAAPALADLIDVHADVVRNEVKIDGVIGDDEYGPGNAYGYTGGGSGFGGTLGGGVLYMNSDTSNLYIGFKPGNDLNDLVFIQLDTREGGYLDADMADRADGGRRAASEQTLNADDAYPDGVLPDFSVIIASWGMVLFELTEGDTDGHLIFISYDGTFTGNDKNLAREYKIPLSTLGMTTGGTVSFFAGYTSDSAYNSNESIPPYDPLNSGDNPGFDGPSAGYGNYDAFVTEPEVLIDGNVDGTYCEAMAVQDTQTGFGDSDRGLVDFANGSEFDGAYAIIRDGVLYLCLAGNVESNFNKVDVWIDSRDGGQNKLRGDNAFGGVNRQGDDGSGNGLEFDDGFAPDFWVSYTGGGDPFTIYIDYCELREGDNPGDGYYVGQGSAADKSNQGELSGGNNPFGIRCTIDNSNTLGVTGGTGIEENGLADDVTTGVEFAIPFGAIGDPTGDLKLCVYINGQNHDFLSNQILPPIGGGENLAEPRNVNFKDFDGTQWFTLPSEKEPCGACCVDETCSVSTADACAEAGGEFLGVGINCFGNPCSAVETGACCVGTSCSITTADDCANQSGEYLGDNTTCLGDPCLVGACCIGTSCSILREEACAEQGGAYLGDGSSCDGEPCARGACCLSGRLCVRISPADCSNQGGDYQGDDTDCSGDPCDTPPETPVIDGTADEGYGDALVIQDTQTGFGDSNLGNVDTANGSELDGAFVKIVGNRLFIVFAGNLESNLNDLEIFFDTRDGGQNQLRGDNPDVDFDGLNRMGESEDPPAGPGLKFDEGFDADFYLTVQDGGTPYALYVNWAELRIDDDTPGVGRYLGKGGAVSDGGLLGGDNPDGVVVTINNSNVDGVTGGFGFEFNGGEGVLTGVELSIPFNSIGNPTGDFEICVFVNGQRHDFISNQSLAGGQWAYGQYPGEPRTASFADDVIFGPQFFTAAYTPPTEQRGDSNCDGSVDFDDIDCFVAALISEDNWNDCGHGGGCTYTGTNDIDQNGSVDFDDIDGFVECLINEGCP
jgi:hypothetical protein